MKKRLSTFKKMIETKYYKKHPQEVWDLYLGLLRFWGCFTPEDRKFINNSKKLLLGR